jgi:ABC-2 type transport system permease protein
VPAATASPERGRRPRPGGVLDHVRMFPTFLKVGFAEMVAYQAEVVIWILTTTMPLIMYAMWSSLARVAPVGRFDEPTFAAYFLSTLVVRQLSSAWVVWELNHQIRTGRLSPLLLRPAHPLLYHAATNLGAVPMRLALLVPVVGLALWVLPPLPFAVGPGRGLLFLWTCFGAWFLNFTLQATIGLLALYTEQSTALQDAFFGLWAVLSGYLIPLELLPGLYRVAVWLPFRAMGSLPTELALGHLDGEATALGCGIQLGWMILSALGLRSMWRVATRRFEAYGA